MPSDTKSRLLPLGAALAAGLATCLAADLAAPGGAAQANDGGGGSAGAGACPVAHGALARRLREAVAEAGGKDVWGSVVDRDGVVCAVAFSGADRDAQLPAGRVISAAKAFTANGVSVDGAPLSTAQLYPLAQPRGSLFGVEAGTPVDPAAAYRGPAGRYGTASDPMLGRRVGGRISFGGGVALFRGGSRAVGGLGVAGDTACADDGVARDLRRRLGLAPSASDAASFGGRSDQHPAC